MSFLIKRVDPSFCDIVKGLEEIDVCANSYQMVVVEGHAPVKPTQIGPESRFGPLFWAWVVWAALTVVVIGLSIFAPDSKWTKALRLIWFIYTIILFFYTGYTYVMDTAWWTALESGTKKLLIYSSLGVTVLTIAAVTPDVWRQAADDATQPAEDLIPDLAVAFTEAMKIFSEGLKEVADDLGDAVSKFADNSGIGNILPMVLLGLLAYFLISKGETND